VPDLAFEHDLKPLTGGPDRSLWTALRAGVTFNIKLTNTLNQQPGANLPKYEKMVYMMVGLPDQYQHGRPPAAVRGVRSLSAGTIATFQSLACNLKP
jgi:hypothetical protein